MRLSIWLIAAAVFATSAMPASAATAPSPSPGTAGHPGAAVPSGMHYQSIQPVCTPVSTTGYDVNIPGTGHFTVQSIEFKTGPKLGMMTAGMSESHERGSIEITKLADSASPKLYELQKTNKLMPTVTITMRKAGAGPSEYMLWNLSDASIVNSTRTASGETLLMSYRSAVIKQCSGAGGGK